MYTNGGLKEIAALSFIKVLPHIDIVTVQKTNYNNEIYFLLYVGKAKNGHQRLIEYHILDKNKFHDTGVQNGRLSSLRQTICGIMGWEMSKSKKQIDDFIDDNCLVEYQIVNLHEILKIESDLIKENYPILNSQNTKSIFPKQHRKILAERKRSFKK